LRKIRYRKKAISKKRIDLKKAAEFTHEISFLDAYIEISLLKIDTGGPKGEFMGELLSVAHP
jgi:hypothetical protein